MNYKIKTLGIDFPKGRRSSMHSLEPMRDSDNIPPFPA
jgi:hypothetical protein